MKEVVKGLVKCIWFNTYFIILATNLFNSTPQYVIVSIIVMGFLVVIGLFALLFYYIYRKFNSIDNHTNKKYDSTNYDKDNPNTYKSDKKEYKKDISELEAKILPDEQTAINTINKVIEFKKKK